MLGERMLINGAFAYRQEQEGPVQMNRDPASRDAITQLSFGANSQLLHELDSMHLHTR